MTNKITQRYIKHIFRCTLLVVLFISSILFLSQYNTAAAKTPIGKAYSSSLLSTPSCSNTIRIMPLGDSITHGVYGSGFNNGSGDPRLDSQIPGYRQPLYDMLTNIGYDVNFVGSLQAGEAIVPAFDADHEGHRGKPASYIAANVYDFLVANPADIILLHIGTNMLNESPDDVALILNEIDRYEQFSNTTITVVLARIINRSSYSQTTTNFNNNVAAMAQARITAGDDIILVDMENGAGLDYNIEPVGDMGDNLHPYDTGYAKIAQVWYDALLTILPDCPVGATITSDPVTQAYVNQPYSYDVNAIGSPTINYSLNVAPPGMTIDSSTGLISWTPTQIQSNITVEVVATNLEGSDVQSYTLNVVAAPPTPTSTPTATPFVVNCQSPTALFIGSTNPLPNRDQLLVNHLQAAGITVVVKDQNSATTAKKKKKNL
ncbi:MAG: putative Ig domain-containing protein, partial [Anaerolineae bacterium]|nr:putative Ig domain-containing protein [Anaerolineae bacterium]